MTDEMPLLEALSAKERQSDQGWTYSNRYNPNYGQKDDKLNKLSSSVEELSAHSSQHQSSSHEATTGPGSNMCAEIISSESEDEVNLVYDPEDDELSLVDAFPMDSYQDSHENHAQNHSQFNIRPQSRDEDSHQVMQKVSWQERRHHLNPHVSRHRQMKLPVHETKIAFGGSAPPNQLQNARSSCPKQYRQPGASTPMETLEDHVHYNQSQSRQSHHSNMKWTDSQSQRHHLNNRLNRNSQSASVSAYGSHYEHGNNHEVHSNISLPVTLSQPSTSANECLSSYFDTNNSNATFTAQQKVERRSWHMPQKKEKPCDQNLSQKEQACMSQASTCTSQSDVTVGSCCVPSRHQMHRTIQQAQASFSHQKLHQQDFLEQGAQSHIQSHNPMFSRSQNSSWNKLPHDSWQSSPEVSPYFPTETGTISHKHKISTQNYPHVSLQNSRAVIKRQGVAQDLEVRGRHLPQGDLMEYFDNSSQDMNADEESGVGRCNDEDTHLFGATGNITEEHMIYTNDRSSTDQHLTESYDFGEDDDQVYFMNDEDIDTSDRVLSNSVSYLAAGDVNTPHPALGITADSFHSEHVAGPFDMESDDFGIEEEEDFGDEEDFEDDFSEYGSAPGESNSNMDNHSPPPLPVSVPCRSAMNEVWPTPMPQLSDKREKADTAAEDAVVESVKSGGQGSCSSPTFDFSPKDHQKGSKRVSSEGSLRSSEHAHHEGKQSKEVCSKRGFDADVEESALCPSCGNTSSNLVACDSCHQTFLPESVVKKRKISAVKGESGREKTCGGGKMNDSPPSKNVTINKKMFYGNKSAQRTSNFHSAEKIVIKRERNLTQLRRICMPSAENHGGKSAPVKEPVTVTISSDEDEIPDDKNIEQGAGSSTRVVSTSLATSGRTTQVSTSSTSMSASGAEEDGFFFSPAPKPASSFGVSRRLRMEDASGQSSQKTVSHHMPFVGEGIFFSVSGVHIGTLRTEGLEVRFMTQSIQFTVCSDTTGEELDFFIYISDIKSFNYSLDASQPVIFIEVSPGCGGRLRSHLKMKAGSSEYFDPASNDLTKNMIVILIERMTDECGLREMLAIYGQSQKGGMCHVIELFYDDANDLLRKALPTDTGADQLKVQEMGAGDRPTEDWQEMDPALAMSGDAGEASTPVFKPYDDEEDYQQDRSPSPPYIGFVGPVEKLLTYPPPPSKGGIMITNEDLFCLNEGEFLNDVILDFYLKFLFLERLSEEDQKRTHIFSSFFFKRLMQKQAHCAEEESKLPPPERRHARVKTWTRKVDIFSKDFLLIPINENAHWFLAIVCFPSLAVEEFVSYIPTPLLEEEQCHPGPSTAQEPEGQVEETGEKKNLDSSLDQHEPPTEKAKDESPLGPTISEQEAKGGGTKFSLGLRQACILIMDSLMGPPRKGIVKVLKEYLQVEWDQKRKTQFNIVDKMKGDCAMVPQQTNYSDCGVFVLQYAESFFENPIANFSLPMNLENWFPMDVVQRKREEIYRLILDLKADSAKL